MLDEKKLCPKGKAYYNRRIAAGEKPSAYLSGRAVKVCKGLMKEDEDNFRGIDPSEAYNDVDAINTLRDKKRDVAFIVAKSNTPENWKYVQKVIQDNGIKVMYVKGNPYDAYVAYLPGSENKATQLKDLAEKYGGYLASNATADDTRKIGKLLGYKEDKIEQYIKDRYIDEARVLPQMQRSREDILRYANCLQKLRKKFNVDSISTLDLKIGKYNLSGQEKGIKVSWDEGKDKLNSTTRNNAEKLFNSLNITPTDIYVGIVPTRCAYSFYIIGTYNNNPIAIVRKETESPMAGQTYLVTPNIKNKLNKFGDESFPTNSLEESLRDWFEKEDWVRIDTQGNITGPCGTMKKGKATTRCLPRAKANRLTKDERAATARKKVAGSKKGKQFVPNTEKAKVKLNKEDLNEMDLKKGLAAAGIALSTILGSPNTTSAATPTSISQPVAKSIIEKVVKGFEKEGYKIDFLEKVKYKNFDNVSEDDIKIEIIEAKTESAARLVMMQFIKVNKLDRNKTLFMSNPDENKYVIIYQTNLKKEARVVPPISKSKIVDDVYEFNPYLLKTLLYYDTIEELIGEMGYDNLEDYLKDNWGWGGDPLYGINLNQTTAKNLITTYYNTIKPGDIKRVDNKTSVAGYVHVEEICDDDNECVIVLTKF
jgi:hypothetical protein